MLEIAREEKGADVDQWDRRFTSRACRRQYHQSSTRRRKLRFIAVMASDSEQHAAPAGNVAWRQIRLDRGERALALLELSSERRFPRLHVLVLHGRRRRQWLQFRRFLKETHGSSFLLSNHRGRSLRRSCRSPAGGSVG